MTSPAPPAADRVTLTCRTCGHSALASAALARHRLACPNCGQPLSADVTPVPAPSTAAEAPIAEPMSPAPAPTESVRRTAGLPPVVVGGLALALLAGIGGVWYVLVRDTDPTLVVEPDFKMTPTPVGRGLGLRAPALPPAPVHPPDGEGAVAAPGAFVAPPTPVGQPPK